MNVIKMKTYGNQFVIQLGTTPIENKKGDVVQRVEPLRKDGKTLIFKTKAEADAFMKAHGKKVAADEAARLAKVNADALAARKKRAG